MGTTGFDLPPAISTILNLAFSRNDPTRKTKPNEVGDFDLHGSVCAR